MTSSPENMEDKITRIEGWVTHQDRGPGYELGGGAGWCEFNESPGKQLAGDQRATLFISKDSIPPKVWTEHQVEKLVYAIKRGLPFENWEKIAAIVKDLGGPTPIE